MNSRSHNPLDALIRFCLENRMIVVLMVALLIGWGLRVAPFDWKLGGLPRDPVPVDAIPDIGENQQIIFTEWKGRSPQDVEDQITYPLTTALLGMPGVKTIRSFSMLGFSSIYVIFKEEIEFYWSRARLLEKLASLPAGTLPEGVQPKMGPDATALGQVFWYTLEGHDAEGLPTGGWSLEELRTIQDWQVRYALMSAEGVSEVASVGGHVREYQVDVDPDALRAAGVTLTEVVAALRGANRDVGARTLEVNRVEYVVRGIGFVKDLADLEETAIRVVDNVPIYVRNVAHVSFGPAQRRGALDKAGAPAVGGVVVVRYGANPLATIKHVKEKIREIAPGLPRKALADGTVSQVTIVPFYDRTGLIYETLGTLNAALLQEILITILVVLLMVMHLRSSLLIASLLPLAVLASFIAMRIFTVDANIVALSGIAIAIGTIVDMGIILTENILKHLAAAPATAPRGEVIFRAAREVSGAVITAVATTVISFLPIFTMEAAEGKLFKPLAFTKTFALLAAIIITLTIIPPAAHVLLRRPNMRRALRVGYYILLLGAGVAAGFMIAWWAGLLIGLLGLHGLLAPHLRRRFPLIATGLVALLVVLILAEHWLPLGVEKGLLSNALLVALMVGGLLGAFRLFLLAYPRILGWALVHKGLFLMIPGVLVFTGALIWLGFETIFGWLPQPVRTWRPVVQVAHAFPGLGKEFMPPLDEGSFLYMPTTMPHAGIAEVLEILQKQDAALAMLPEIDQVVGKLGRVESPLDPAPLSMIETLINYKSEYVLNERGRRVRFRFDGAQTDWARSVDGTRHLAPDGRPYRVAGRYARDERGALIPDRRGRPFRQWRPALEADLNPNRTPFAGIDSPADIWDAIVAAAQIPGTTSAPRLQPIAARIVMLQSGMRAPLGLKIKGPDLETIEAVGLKIEQLLKEVPSIEPSSVFADRVVGKPYLEIEVDRAAAARYGISVERIQRVIEIAIGGERVTTTVEGRARFGVRVRYLREKRDDFDAIARVLVGAPGGGQIPLTQLADIRYVRGPQAIKSEDTFLVGYVLFEKRPGRAEVQVVEQTRQFLEEKIRRGEWVLPAGVSYTFAGSYENQVRAERKLMIVLPLALLLIVTILHLQFRSLATTFFVFSGIAVAWAGGFWMIWLYGRPWFLDFALFGTSLRELFQIHPINLSVAVWVGFLALFGIATDDGVVIATYLKQTFARRRPRSVAEIRAATVEAGKRRARPCLMTTATTLLALLPILTSTGRGADVMIPMAIPSFGGMAVEILTMLVVPVLYSWRHEGCGSKIRAGRLQEHG